MATMRLRGLLPSCGAGASLIAAALVAVAIVGGIIAFRGDRSGTGGSDGGAVTLPNGAIRAHTVSRVVPADVARPSRRRAAVARPRVRRARPLRRVASRRPARQAPVGAPDRPAATAPGRSSAPSAPAAPPTPSAPRAGGPKRPADPGVEQPAPLPMPVPVPGPVDTRNLVTHTVQEVRRTAQPVVEVLPPPVAAPVDRGGDTVEQVGGAVDETLAPVTGLVP